jgi:hypothetical protein
MGMLRGLLADRFVQKNRLVPWLNKIEIALTRVGRAEQFMVASPRSQMQQLHQVMMAAGIPLSILFIHSSVCCGARIGRVMRDGLSDCRRYHAETLRLNGLGYHLKTGHMLSPKIRPTGTPKTATLRAPSFRTSSALAWSSFPL